MDVGSIGGGAMASGASTATGTSAPSLVGQPDSGAAPAPTTVGDALSGSNITGVEQLAEMMEGFNSAEILMALMMAAAMQKDDDEESSGSAVAGFLAGLALAGQLAQNLEFDLQAPVAETTAGGSVGGSLNATA